MLHTRIIFANNALSKKLNNDVREVRGRLMPVDELIANEGDKY